MCGVFNASFAFRNVFVVGFNYVFIVLLVSEVWCIGYSIFSVNRGLN